MGEKEALGKVEHRKASMLAVTWQIHLSTFLGMCKEGAARATGRRLQVFVANRRKSGALSLVSCGQWGLPWECLRLFSTLSIVQASSAPLKFMGIHLPNSCLHLGLGPSGLF